MSISELQVQTALKEITDPNTGKDFVSSRSAKNIKIEGAAIAVDIELGYLARSLHAGRPRRTKPFEAGLLPGEG